MTRRFPKIGPNGFPYLENARPFERDVTFDYGRYDYTATVKLLRVSWASDYRHVVNWASERDRDAWFDAQQGNVIELQQGTLRTQTDRITLDVPYDVALTYNYAYLRVPQITQDRPIDHEQAGGIRTVCAFIVGCEYLSPSATEITLSVDFWTTYLPYKSVHGMILERGHAPMWALDASTYLEDPIDRCENLLAPDINVGTAEVVRGGDFAPLSVAHPMYVIASTIPYGEIDGIATATSQSSTPPSYYDIDARNGHQVGVSGYQWASGKGYANMDSPSTATHADGSIPSGLYYYGILGSAVSTGALDTLLSSLPVFALSCKAVFVVPSDLVTVGRTHTISGIALRELTNKGLQAVRSFDVNKQLFDYPAKYAEIAKLYTEPYAHLEVSDDLGNSVTVAIENTDGTVEVSQMLSIAFPALEWRAAVTNVASTAGDIRYAWARLNGSLASKTVTNADFANTFLDFGIPTYALYLESRTEQALTSWASAQQQRANALLAYQSTMRSANTSEQNTLASNATARANAYRSADTSVTNTANTGNNNTANTNISNNLRTTVTSLNNDANYDVQEIQAQGIFDLGYADDEYTMLASDANLKSEAVTAAANIAGAAAAGNGLGVMQAGISGIVNITTSNTLATYSSDNIEAKEAINQGIVRDTATRQRTLAGSLTVANNSAASSTNTNNVNTANTNATNSANTAKANASASEGTGNANAGYSRGTTEENAKAALENAQSAYGRELAAASVQPPIEHGSYAGTSVHEIWENRGIHLRAVTQPKGAIKQAGDTFLRYGYKLGAAWDVDAWVPDGRRYCYWQSMDLWQCIDEVGNAQAERTLEDILAAGTTVWASPEDVGRFEA